MTDASLNAYLQATTTGLIKSQKDHVHKFLECTGPNTINGTVQALEKIRGKRVSDRAISSALSALHKEGLVEIVSEVVQDNGYKASLYRAVSK